MERVIVKPRAGWLEEAAIRYRRAQERIKAAGTCIAPYDPALFDVAAGVLQAGQLGYPRFKLNQAVDDPKARCDPVELQEAETLYELGACLRETGQCTKAEDHFRRALEIFEAQLGAEDLEVGVTLHALGVCWRDAGKVHEAEPQLRRALKIFLAELGREHPHVTVTLYELGLCMRQAGRLRDAEAHLFQALDILELNRERDDLHVAETLHALALCARQAGRPGEAEFHLLGALEIKEAKLGPAHPQVGVTLHELGICYLMSGRLVDADLHLQRALDIYEARSGSSDLQGAGTLHSLGLCARKAGRLVEAEIHFRRARKIFEAKLGLDDPQVAATWHEMALCVRDAGRHQEAEEYLRRALEVSKRSKTGTGDSQEGTTLHELGVCMRKAGRLREAETHFRRSLTVSEANPGSSSLDVAATLHELGLCVQAAGRHKEAEYLMRRALNIMEAHLGSDDIGVAELELCVQEVTRSVKLDAQAQHEQSSRVMHHPPPDAKRGPEAQPEPVARPGRSGRPWHTKAYSSGALFKKELSFAPEIDRAQATLKEFGDSLRGARRAGETAISALPGMKHLDTREGSDDERSDLNRRLGKDRSREMTRGTLLAATKKWKSARTIHEAGGHDTPPQAFARRETSKLEPIQRRAPTNNNPTAVPSDNVGISSGAVADADGGAGLPVSLARRGALLGSGAGGGRPRRRGHHKSSSIVASDLKCGTVVRGAAGTARSGRGREGFASRGESLALHTVGRVSSRPCYWVGSGRHRRRVVSVVLVPPGEMYPVSGPDVVFHRWRDEHGRVELRTAPRDAKHVGSVRLLDRVFTDQVSCRGESGPCIISPVIEGPGHTRFTSGTATVSFFLGRRDSLAAAAADGRVCGKRELEAHALDTCFPVVKGDGSHQRWEADGAFTVAWKGEELWLETPLLHFSERGVARKCAGGWKTRLPRSYPRQLPASESWLLSPPKRAGELSVEAGPLVSPPLGSSRYPAGWAEVENCTQASLEVVIVPEAVGDKEQAAHPGSDHVTGKLLRSKDSSRGGTSERGPNNFPRAAPGVSGLSLLGLGPDESRGILLPGAGQARLLWCSVTGALTPEDLPYGNEPNVLSEARLGDLGYTVGGGLLLKRCFVSSRTGKSHRSLVVLRVWDDAIVAPFTYSRILPKRLSQPCLWEAAVPSKAYIGAKLSEYVSSTAARTR